MADICLFRHFYIFRCHMRQLEFSRVDPACSKRLVAALTHFFITGHAEAHRAMHAYLPALPVPSARYTAIC